MEKIKMYVDHCYKRKRGYVLDTISESISTLGTSYKYLFIKRGKGDEAHLTNTQKDE